MASCAQHGAALVPVVRSPWLARDRVPREPQRAARDLLVLDHDTLGAATGGTARLPGHRELVPKNAWLRALRALLDELTCPVSWLAPEGRAEVDGAWWRVGRTLRKRQLCQSDLFEHQPPTPTERAAGGGRGRGPAPGGTPRDRRAGDDAARHRHAMECGPALRSVEPAFPSRLRHLRRHRGRLLRRLECPHGHFRPHTCQSALPHCRPPTFPWPPICSVSSEQPLSARPA